LAILAAIRRACSGYQHNRGEHKRQPTLPHCRRHRRDGRLKLVDGFMLGQSCPNRAPNWKSDSKIM
jgi:hypothetical protein